MHRRHSPLEPAYILWDYEQGDLFYSTGPHGETALAKTDAAKK